LSQVILYCLLFLFCAVTCRTTGSRAARQAVLLLSSYALYVTWGPWFAAVLLTSTAMNFLFGKWLRRRPSAGALSVGISLNLALLATFKYLPEAAVHISLSSFQGIAHLALPLGLSFWTFQAMSYLFDLYRGEELDPSLVEFALYMAFFPVVISGPICRLPDMLPQFRSSERTAWTSIGEGFARIATGVLMMQLARLLGQGILSGDGIDRGFDRVTAWSGIDVWCVAFGFGLQLFFNFAGYSHIAVGAAKALGFVVPENFDRPFLSTTPSVFWTRWHMSLSFWIRDYVFLPLAVMRREIWWRTLALVFSMVLFGVWHKASLLFVIWGCYHGVLLLMHRQIQQLQRRFEWSPAPALWSLFSWIVTSMLVSLGWIFFRASSLSQARQMLLAVLSFSTYFSHYVSGSLYGLVVALAAGYAVVLMVSTAIHRSSVDSEDATASRQTGVIAALARSRWFWIPPLYVLAMLLVLIVTHARDAGAAQFMYRNF
jgi:alginate O-acetyltransferase complex protein AlgI